MYIIWEIVSKNRINLNKTESLIVRKIKISIVTQTSKVAETCKLVIWIANSMEIKWHHRVINPLEIRAVLKMELSNKICGEILTKIMTIFILFIMIRNKKISSNSTLKAVHLSMTIAVMTITPRNMEVKIVRILEIPNFKQGRVSQYNC